MLILLAIVLGVAALSYSVLVWTPEAPEDYFKEWEWPASTVAPTGCMGVAIEAPDAALVNQKWIDGKKLPDETYEYIDPEGNTVSGVRVPRVGTAAGFNADGDEIPAVPGTFKDCCDYLRVSGSNGAGIAVGDLCYAFDFMELDPEAALPDGSYAPMEPANFKNVFPLKDQLANLTSVADMDLGTDAKVLMIPCGGENQIPCGYLDCTAEGAACTPEHLKANWVTKGCSQTGGATQTGGAGDPNLKLYRTLSQSPLPYGGDTDDPFQVCRTRDNIQFFGWDPATGRLGGGSLPPYNAETGQYSRFASALTMH